MADLILGALVMGAASAALPLLANGLISVKRPKRVNIEQARVDARVVRPVIPYHAPVPYTGGRVRALFIGINYRGTKSELSGCVNDVTQMLGTLQRITFPISECCILVDDPSFPNFTAMPTRANIIAYMAWLTNDLRSGDVLFMHYSGHGGQTKSSQDSEEEYDQCLMPLDYERNGSILDDDLFLMLVASLPPGVRMTCVFDCCHSATMLDLPFSFVGGRGVSSNNRYEMKAVRRNNFSSGDVVMFSGCDDAGTSADVRNGPRGLAGGAATQAFTWALTNTQGYDYLNILMRTRDILASKKYKQVPQLTSSKPIDLYKPFSLFGPITVNETMMQQYVPQQYRFAPPPPPPQGYPPLLYQQPQPSYGPPQPQQVYGPPQPQQVYGPPQPQQVYGPPQPQQVYARGPTQGGYPPPPGPGYYGPPQPGMHPPPPGMHPPPPHQNRPPGQYSYSPYR